MGKWFWRSSIPTLNLYPRDTALEILGAKAESSLVGTNLFAVYLLSDPSISVEYDIGPMAIATMEDDE